MTRDERFGLVVSVDECGVVKVVERCTSKFEAANAAEKWASESLGVTYVAMDCHEAYRSEPRVERVYLDYPTLKAEQPPAQQVPIDDF